MDFFEKQQRIDSIKGIIKARWFAIAILLAVGLILKTKHFSWSPNLDFLKMAIMTVVALGYNFTYWLYIRRPIEKIGDRGLTVISLLQVLGDQIVYTIDFYYAGSIESVNFIFYFITILIASSLYGRKGIILSWLTSVGFLLAVILAEYYRIIPHIYPFGHGNPFDNPIYMQAKMISLPLYLGIAAGFSIVLSGLFRKHEKGLREKSDKLQAQTQSLSRQAQELTHTKNWLHEALTKSDKARTELTETKEKLEKINLELNAKVEELEKFYRITVGRELKMAELKSEMEKLKKSAEK